MQYQPEPFQAAGFATEPGLSRNPASVCAHAVCGIVTSDNAKTITSNSLFNKFLRETKLTVTERVTVFPMTSSGYPVRHSLRRTRT
jgi:hypothetical protein